MQGHLKYAVYGQNLVKKLRLKEEEPDLIYNEITVPTGDTLKVTDCQGLPLNLYYNMSDLKLTFGYACYCDHLPALT